MGISKKREGILCHKLLILSSLLIETINELEYDGEMPTKYKEELKDVTESAETVVASVFKDVPELTSMTYIQKLSSQVDTVIRKNHEPITGSLPAK